MTSTSVDTEEATSMITSNAVPSLDVMTGTPSLIIPAFSYAIFSKVSPRYSVCSMLMLVITETSGCNMLVASYLPPIPTSTTAYSTPLSLKNSNAMAVVTSKNVHCIPFECISSTWGLISVMYLSNSSSLIDCPETLILSLKSNMWGDVYNPVLIPEHLSIDSIIAHVEPLPSVPATCIDLNEF